MKERKNDGKKGEEKRSGKERRRGKRGRERVNEKGDD